MTLRLLIINILRPIDFVLQILVPAHQRRICYLSRPDYTDNAYYVYRHLINTRSNIEHIWLVYDESLATRITEEFALLTRKATTSGHRLLIFRRQSIRGYIAHLRSKWVFHTHGTYSVTNRAHGRHIVCLWHGMPIKCIGRLNHVCPNPYPTFGTTHVATSHFFRYVIAGAFAARPESVLISGLPRCDPLRHESARQAGKTEIHRLLGVPDDAKLVLWMPTYRTEGVTALNRGPLRSFLDDLPGWTMESIAHHSALNNCRIVVKLHPKDPLNHVGVIPDNITILRSQDWQSHGIQLYDLIAASDALLSDVSSVLIDYLETMRPIGIIGFSEDTYTRDLIFPMEYLLHSSRFDHLVNENAVAEFFGRVGEAGEALVARHDVSLVLNAPRKEPSAENVARGVGL